MRLMTNKHSKLKQAYDKINTAIYQNKQIFHLIGSLVIF